MENIKILSCNFLTPLLFSINNNEKIIEIICFVNHKNVYFLQDYSEEIKQKIRDYLNNKIFNKSNFSLNFDLDKIKFFTKLINDTEENFRK